VALLLQNFNLTAPPPQKKRVLHVNATVQILKITSN